MDGLVVLLSIGAALMFAVAAALKHASAGDVPHVDAMSLPALSRLVYETVHHPLWWAGTAVDVVAVSLHVLALHRGALALVQPLLVTVLVFGLVVRSIGHGGIPRRELLWAVVLSVALAGFLAIAGTAAAASADQVDRGPALGAGIVAVVLAGASVAVARSKFAGRGAAAAWYGIAAGTAYAATAALLKTLTGIVAVKGFIAVFGSWQLYVVLAVGAVGVVLTQLAYQAGPLAASLPAITMVNPLLSIVIGVVVYDEDIRHGLVSSAAMAALLLVMGLAIFQLTKGASQPAERSSAVPGGSGG
jgi:hypothetical protein